MDIKTLKEAAIISNINKKIDKYLIKIININLNDDDKNYLFLYHLNDYYHYFKKNKIHKLIGLYLPLLFIPFINFFVSDLFTFQNRIDYAISLITSSLISFGFFNSFIIIFKYKYFKNKHKIKLMLENDIKTFENNNSKYKNLSFYQSVLDFIKIKNEHGIELIDYFLDNLDQEEINLLTDKNDLSLFKNIKENDILKFILDNLDKFKEQEIQENKNFLNNILNKHLVYLNEDHDKDYKKIEEFLLRINQDTTLEQHINLNNIIKF